MAQTLLATAQTLRGPERPEAPDPLREEIPRSLQGRPVSADGPGATGVAGLATAGPLTVRWEGAQFVRHSLAHVNRELCLGLLDTGRVELSLVPTEPAHFPPGEEARFVALAARAFRPLSRPADVHVRHFFPPRLHPPDEGHFVLIQPWEYGHLPIRWIGPICEGVREVWCYSRYVRDVYRASGVPEEKLRVVPLGVDLQVFTPEALPYLFTHEPGAAALAGGERRRFVFLFVGGTLHRKGIDVLLDAYSQAFSAADDVCLVVKDTGTQTVYRGQNERERILGEVQDPARPRIVYVEPDLSGPEMAGLYAAADCLVQPYRGEGFCLPALEAMACGRPVIVPAGGPTDDFVDEAVGWRVPAGRPFGNGRIGDWDCVGPTWMFEVDPHALAGLMRRVYDDREEAERRGRAAAERVRAGWTWRHAAEAALERLQALARVPPVRPMRGDPPLPPPRDDEVLAPSPEHGEAPRTRATPEISLCMIVRNEERVLGDCLASVRRWVDEIVVVDTGSTDRTVAMAEEFGARVFRFPWCDDFAAARNESLRHATGDWVLWMDADDTLPEECGRRLHDVAFLAEDRVTGFLMQVQIPPAPGEAGFTVVDHVKLFRNLPGLGFEGRIHEQILEPLYRQGGQVERSDLYVVHSGYDYSLEGQAKKRARDLTLLEKDLADRPDHPFVLFNIGMTAFHLKDFDGAREALERCLAVSKPQESMVRKVYAMLAGCRQAQGDVPQAREWVERGLRLFPRDPELLFRAGVVFREAGDLPAAERSYLTLLTAREAGHIDSLDVSITGFKAHHNLALVYQDLGRWEDAGAQWRAAVEKEPGFVPSWVGLGELALRRGDSGAAGAVCDRLEALAPADAERLRQALRATPETRVA